MLRLTSRSSGHGGQIELNVIPLIDVVFFLLVFYVITTSFVQESAVPVSRPASARATPVTGGFVAVAITRTGTIQLGSQMVTVSGLVGALGPALATARTTRVLVIPDRTVPTGQLLAVMDACRQGGATAVDVAASRL